MAVNPNGIIKGFNILKYKPILFQICIDKYGEPIGMFVVNDMKMVEFILWTDNPKTDIDKISHYIGIQPIEKKRMGEMRCLT